MPALMKIERYIIASLSLLLIFGLAAANYKKHGAMRAIWIEKFDYSDIAREDGPASRAGGERRVNVNSASPEELMCLDGIGRTIAGRIIDYRALHGPFLSPEKLKAVRGLTQKILSRNRDKIAVDDS